MKKQLTAFIVVASLASGLAHANADVSIKNRFDAIVIADKFCGDLGKSFSAFPWHTKLSGAAHGRCGRQMMKEEHFGQISTL
jgi:hypothetical protein